MYITARFYETLKTQKPASQPLLFPYYKIAFGQTKKYLSYSFSVGFFHMRQYRINDCYIFHHIFTFSDSEKFSSHL